MPWGFHWQMHREAKSLVQGHTATTRLTQGLHLGSRIPAPPLEHFPASLSRAPKRQTRVLLP